MAIDRNTFNGFVGLFLEALELDPDVDHSARQTAVYQLQQVAELLPQPETWMVDTQTGVLMLLVRDALFTITRGKPEGQERQVVVKCHAPRVIEVTYRRWGRRTFWEFQFRHRDSLSIEGRLEHPARPDDPEPPDQAETFARTLAKRGGWDVESSLS